MYKAAFLTLRHEAALLFFLPCWPVDDSCLAPQGAFSRRIGFQNQLAAPSRMPGWNDLPRSLQERVFLLVAHNEVGISFPEPLSENRTSALHAVLLSRSHYSIAVKALWQHLWISETDLSDPKHVCADLER